MFEYNETLRAMTQDEENLILTVIHSLKFKPNNEFIVYCDTTNPLCIPFIATLIKRVKAECRGISGCMLYQDKIVFGGRKH